METARQHIEEIRRKKFSIGGEPNPLIEDLHQAVKNLSAELYTKDIHFLMELVQNAEDNEYLAGVKPSLEFVITSKDITATSASTTLLIFNNERGFSRRNIDSICSIGRSTKKRKRGSGYIGEKGIGFKSVFLVTSQPYIFSNGYQIRFNEEPNQDCKIGYVVPEWVVENPDLSEIQQIYGSSKVLPTTTIILPLKSEKVGAVKQQLSSLHAEVLLFLSKIKRLSVKEENTDPRLNTVSAISISSETDFKTRKNIDAESYTLHLSAKENGDGKECRYYMWKQKFPVTPESRVERRMEIDEWVITLAFPFGERLDGKQLNSPGVYAFLPTEMVTNFPFIIQADFVLASSRETILLDNKWNRGILAHVPSAFISAFIFSVKTAEAPPLPSLLQWFEFLPVKNATYIPMNIVRNMIQQKMIAVHSVPCESFTQQLFFSKPSKVGRLLQSFWNVLNKAKQQNLSLQSVSSHGTYILNSAFDRNQYDEILNFLGIKFVPKDWYAKCIQSSNLVLGVSEDVYLELLCFLADNWSDYFVHIPILKYSDHDGSIGLRSINESKCLSESIYVSTDVDHIDWLIKWSREFHCAKGGFFMPEHTQKTLRSFSRRETIKNWFQKQASVKDIDVYSYGYLLVNAVKKRRPVIALTHFLYHSLKKNYLSEGEVSRLCASMRIVDNYGHVTNDWRGVLIPANGSKWVELMGSNPWREEMFVELGADYICPANYGDVYTSANQLLKFLETYIQALDIPELSPPNSEFPSVFSPLTQSITFLLLDWIRNLKYKGIRMPEKFLRCIKKGSWLKTGLGYKPPSESFLSSSGWEKLLKMGSALVDIPLIDERFYGDKISSYKDELKAIGVMFESNEACTYIANRLMSLAASCRLTKENVFSMLNFIKILRENYLPLEEFINSVKHGKWLKTSHGERTPIGSVLFDSEWEVVSHITCLPFIDEKYYGREIRRYRPELQLLDVLVGFNQNYKLVAENFKLPKFLTRDSVLVILGCIRHSGSSEKLLREVRDQRCLKTNLGYKAPAESFMSDPQWECLLKIIDGVPLIDEIFYGSNLRIYKDELKQMGVVVSFEEASKAISNRFKQALSSNTLRRENVFSLLECYKHLKAISHPLPRELTSCIREEKWLMTRLGNRSPKEAILFDPEWKSLSPIAQLPFIDDTDYGECIYTFRDELKALGVVVEFKKGYWLVARGLNLPGNPSEIDPASVLSLLECIRLMRRVVCGYIPKELMESIDKEWLKTHFGYRSPKECLLFDSKWESYLQREDGPFIDESFYGNKLLSFKEELRAIGVVVDVAYGCRLLAGHLDHHSQLPVIARIYKYMSKHNWQPDNKSARWIWIPHGGEKGEWVSSEGCVIRDRDNLFGLRLNVMEKYYNDNEILNFFSLALGVAHNPTTEDYCRLWKDWENGHQVTNEDLRSFWGHIGKQWSSRTEKIFTCSMSKLPVNTKSGGIRLSNKQEVFIPDDLVLKDLFEKASPESIFVWYPQPSLPSLSVSKLYDIYRSIGVRTISESLMKYEPSMCSDVKLKKTKLTDGLIGKGLLMIILGYLADPSLEMPTNQRQRIAKSLLDLTVSVVVDPITSNYGLPLSDGRTIWVKASKFVLWERKSSNLFVQQFNRTDKTFQFEYWTQFSEAISGALLWQNTDQIAGLYELIMLGAFVQFDVDAVRFLLKKKNLQLFMEDDEFLASAFPSDQIEPKVTE